MPVTPKKGETQKEFLSRCIAEVKRADPDRSNEQAAAICHDTGANRKDQSLWKAPDH
jgi:hypothetical protein